MYTLTGVSKTFQKGRQKIPAVRDVSVRIVDGEWLTIQGRTGHGKTTLLHLLGGLDRPDSGSVEFGGQDLARLREAQLTRVRARSIGFIFQTFNLMPTLSAADNVEAALIPLRLGSRDRHRRVAGALEAVGLADRAHHLPAELSGGQQQRVAIRTCCWLTSRLATSTRAPATRSSPCWRSCPPSAASQSCWSPTTAPSPAGPPGWR